jgi:hypothetical protein
MRGAVNDGDDIRAHGPQAAQSRVHGLTIAPTLVSDLSGLRRHERAHELLISFIRPFV